MKLDTDINYIVSGLERSGTSLLMQILHAGGLPSILFHVLRMIVILGDILNWKVGK